LEDIVESRVYEFSEPQRLGAPKSTGLRSVMKPAAIMVHQTAGEDHSIAEDAGAIGQVQGVDDRQVGWSTVGGRERR